MKKIIFVFLLCVTSIAHARIYIPVNQPSDKKFPIAVCDLVGGGFGEEIADIIRNDLAISGYFNLISRGIFEKHASEEGVTLDTIGFSFWQAIETQAVLKGSVQGSRGKLTIQLRLFDPYTPELLVGKEYETTSGGIRDVAHQFSDEIMLALTGMRGVFTTKIVYAAATGKKAREIFIMDMDGARSHQITSTKTLNLSPSWSPSGKQIVFTSYLHKYPDLYLVGSDGKGLKQLTEKEGANLTPVWIPDGSRIIYTSTVSGEADLYSMAPDGSNHRRLTKTLGIEISPDVAPDGSEIVFSSEQAGNLHVFKMPASGGASQRLTYVGYQNDMPQWSPMADKIAFSGRDMGNFDIFIMNPDGSNIQRLTIRSGSNESPSFSPDGRLITFQSNRDGTTAIYIMRADGTNPTRISKGSGMLPAWGPRTE